MPPNKLLIITSKDDGHADFMINMLNERGLDQQVIRLNTEDFVHNCDVLFDGEAVEILIKDSGRAFHSSEIKAVWYRRPKELEINEADKGVAEFIEAEALAFLRGFYFFCHDTALWVNPLPAMHRGRIKMQQLQLAQRLGFKIPKTIITNQPDKALAFFETVNTVCFKGIGEPNFTIEGQLHALFNRVVTKDEVATQSASIRRCPTLFQEYIPKQFDIRVVVMGAEIFAFEIHSQEHPLAVHDFRGVSPDYLTHRLHQLPEPILAGIRQFMKQQGLVFSSMDFVLSKDGDYYFLENNCNGQWLWLELLTNVKLSESMLRLLLG